MLKAIFTLDYEIHGNGDGSPYELMVEPTQRMMALFEEYGAKLTIMADVAEILKFRELKETTGRDECSYDAIAAQLQDAIRRGHDVQLHLHASYFNARREGGRWVQDWLEYDFANLPAERLEEVVCIGKRFLEDLLKPVSGAYDCIAFRAANWSMSPSLNAVRALLANGFKIDTSVFKHGRREGIVNFDYAHAHHALRPWRVWEQDVCRQDPAGALVEIPIYCEPRRLGAFLTMNRFRRALLSRRHRLARHDGPAASTHRRSEGKLTRLLRTAIGRHAWKADFNQCSWLQLVRAIERAADANPKEILPFVLIGHSKLFSPANEREIRPFLKHVAANSDRLGFASLSSIPLPAPVQPASLASV